MDPGVLERLPGDLQEQALLGIDDVGFLGIDAEEAGIEAVGVRDDASRLDVVRLTDGLAMLLLPLQWIDADRPDSAERISTAARKLLQIRDV